MDLYKYFYEKFVLGGFVSGVWLAVGVDPEAIISDSILNLIKTYNPNLKFGLIFYVIPLIVTAFSLLYAYFMGGKFGMIDIACAFFGGCFIQSYPLAGLLLVGIGGLLGT